MDADIRELYRSARARKRDAGDEEHLVRCFRKCMPEDQVELVILAERRALARIRMRQALVRAQGKK